MHEARDAAGVARLDGEAERTVWRRSMAEREAPHASHTIDRDGQLHVLACAMTAPVLVRREPQRRHVAGLLPDVDHARADLVERPAAVDQLEVVVDAAR